MRTRAGSSFDRAWPLVAWWMTLTACPLTSGPPDAAVAIESCSATCSGCCTEAGNCVPLAQTNRRQCGKAGAACVDGEVTFCPTCLEGSCSYGWECLGPFPPAVCECGLVPVAPGPRPPGGCIRDCGQCASGSVCVEHRCMQSDAGVDDAGVVDAGVDGG